MRLLKSLIKSSFLLSVFLFNSCGSNEICKDELIPYLKEKRLFKESLEDNYQYSCNYIPASFLFKGDLDEVSKEGFFWLKFQITYKGTNQVDFLRETRKGMLEGVSKNHLFRLRSVPNNVNKSLDVTPIWNNEALPVAEFLLRIPQSMLELEDFTISFENNYLTDRDIIEFQFDSKNIKNTQNIKIVC